jgi:protein-tyrosine phosphatase
VAADRPVDARTSPSTGPTAVLADRGFAAGRAHLSRWWRLRRRSTKGPPRRRVHIGATAACFTEATRVELHFHLLPAVDDGPRTLDEALELARLAVADGTGLVVCTPHVHLIDVARLPELVDGLDAALRVAEIPLRVAAGGEIRPGTRLDSAELEILAQGPRGRRWLLLEAPLQAQFLDAFHADADALEARGYGLLIAHPERSAALMAPRGGLGHRLRRGARLQVNASSLTGAHGAGSRAAGFDLVARGLVAAIASDAHGARRPPLLSAAVRALAARGLDGVPLVVDGPRRLVGEGIAAARDRPAA